MSDKPMCCDCTGGGGGVKSGGGACVVVVIGASLDITCYTEWIDGWTCDLAGVGHSADVQMET